MLRSPIELARAGMELAVPVFHPHSGTLLLTEGYSLDRKAIRRLHELGVIEVWIKYPDTERISQYVSRRIVERQSAVLASVAETFDRLHQNAHANLDYADYRQNITALISSLLRDPIAASYIQELSGTSENGFRHAAAVSMISLMLGLKLQGYLVHERPRLRPRDAANVVNLALGGMFHDIGLLTLDEEDRNRLQDAFDEDDPAWLSHPERGYRMLTGKIDPTAAIVALQHHKYLDGSGFPAAPEHEDRWVTDHGLDIHIFSRIVMVADHYDRLRHPPGGDPKLRVEALSKMTREPYIQRFDPVVLRGLFEVVPAYPPGSVVTLNTGDSAVVIDWCTAAPCQPTVQLIGDHEVDPAELVAKAHARQHTDAPIYRDLRHCDNLRIVEQDGIDVSRFNFTIESLGEVSAIDLAA